MRKIATTVIIFLMIVLLLGSNLVYAAENVIDQETESQLIEIKDNAAKSLEDYKQKYGSDAYGLTAYILNIIRIYPYSKDKLTINYLDEKVKYLVKLIREERIGETII